MRVGDRECQEEEILKLFWVNHTWRGGNDTGYDVHSKKLAEAVAALGVSIVYDPMENYDAAVHVIHPAGFHAIPGKVNIAFIQTEMSDVKDPLVWMNEISKADYLVTSCINSRNVESKHYKGPIEVCPLGVDAGLFPFTERKAPRFDEPFRFLWVNNAGNEKGAGLMMETWRQWMASGTMPPNAELYMKLSGEGVDLEFPFMPYPKHKTTYDKRILSVTDLAALYHGAHAFVNTSFGDGFGLTQVEAFSTGLPSTWPAHSAFLDYADEEIGYPVKEIDPAPFWGRQQEVGDMAKVTAYGGAVRSQALIRRMGEIYANYPEALERGRRAAARMRERYTWRQAGERFVNICENMLLQTSTQKALQAEGVTI
jgi:glycosyltransferase involved in cell wall biosynthesis